ncbi:MAG: N-acetylglucosamine kinase [Planctomycetota bacterium]
MNKGRARSMPHLILGLDCGGTKTAAALAIVSDARSEEVHFDILGKGVAGPSNPCSVGEEHAYENVVTAIRDAFRHAALPAQSVASMSVCMAGVGRPEEMQRVRHWALSRELADRVIVTEDVEPVRWAALWETRQSAEPKDWGSSDRWQRIVTLISGTGSIACCTDGEHQNERVGGWGYLLGDEGSGFSIGLQGLKSVCATHDRGLSLSDLHRELLDAMHCRTAMQLIPTVYQIPLPRSEIARLSRIVLRHASTDAQARDMVQQAAESLSLLVRLALQRTGAHDPSYLLAVSGGLLEIESLLLQDLRQSLATHRCAPGHIHLVQYPAHGALFMAAQALKSTNA